MLNAQNVPQDFDIFVTENGKSEIEKAHLIGNLGFGKRAEVANKELKTMDGGVYAHSNLKKFSYESSVKPSLGGPFRAGFDHELGQAQLDTLLFASYLDGLTGDHSIDTRQTKSFNFTSTQELTVLDFKKGIRLGDKTSFTLSGGENDQFIIRANRMDFEKSGIILNGIKPENVVWRVTGDGAGIKESNFFGTIVADTSRVVVEKSTYVGGIYTKELGFKESSFTGNPLRSPNPPRQC